MLPTRNPEQFQRSLLRLVNEVLFALRRNPGAKWTPAGPGTPLFSTGLLDSLSILHLIGAVEQLTGRPVPDRLVSMEHFESIAAITATFLYKNEP